MNSYKANTPSPHEVHLSEFQQALLTQIHTYGSLRPRELPWKNRPKTKKMMRLRAYQNLGHLVNRQLVCKFGMSYYLSEFGRQVVAYLIQKSSEHPEYNGCKYKLSDSKLNWFQLFVIRYLARIPVIHMLIERKKYEYIN